MTKTVFTPSTSSIKNIDVLSIPIGAITNISCPTEVYAGNSFNVTGSVKNNGEYGYLIVQLIDLYTGITVDEQNLGGFDAAQSKNFSLYAVMPNKDWSIRTRVGHWEYDPGTGMDTWITDHYIDSIITLIIAISTLLTLASFPQVQPSETYSYGGRLTRSDNGAGLSSQTIRCDRQEGSSWIEVGTISTDANGYYSKSVTAPTSPGSYPCRTRYLGTPGYFAIDVFEPSTSQTKNLKVGIMQIQDLLYSILPLIVGFALIKLPEMKG